MSGDQDGLTRLQVGDDRVVPVRQHPLEDVLQALRSRQQLWGQSRVARVADLRELVVIGEGRRRCVVRTPPQHELLLAELVQCLFLVLALQRAVVPLVETPGTADRDPLTVARRQ